VTEFSAGISAGAGPYGIAAGPDGNLWFAEDLGNRIGRITTGAAVVVPPTIAKSFGAVTIVLNGSTTLSFTINNPSASTR
jgi:virginiamycin B lyase